MAKQCKRPRVRLIHGIPVKLRRKSTLNAIACVFRRIRERCSSDYQRIVKHVEEIVPVTESQHADSTMGEWEPRDPGLEDRITWVVGIDEAPGTLKLWENAEPETLVPNIAHEFGHVCTRLVDRDRRGDIPDPEWVSEAAADWYAYKWGFGREIAHIRRTRKVTHHGFAPGQADVTDLGEHYRLTRNFVYKRIPHSEPDESFVPALVPFLADTDWRVRCNIAEKLGNFGLATAREALLRASRVETHPEVVAMLDRAIEKLGAAQGRDAT